MYLFVGISIITFLMNFSQSFIKFVLMRLPLVKQEDTSDVLKDIEMAKQELKELNQSEMGDYSRTVRSMRINKKISDLNMILNRRKNMYSVKQNSAILLCGYGVKFILVVMLAYISFMYRYTPVVVFDDRFDFAPLGGIITFPTGIPNAISVPFWIFSCNVSFKWFGGYLKSIYAI